MAQFLVFANGVQMTPLHPAAKKPAGDKPAAGTPPVQHIVGTGATAHDILHTRLYYFQITMRLEAAAAQSAAAVRAVLAGIKSELLAGVFPF